ncbi:MAG: hypothetical protein GXO08_04215 [Aquificae bacterium]|nr:hypothetical protein [Aquificota bacterium]
MAEKKVLGTLLGVALGDGLGESPFLLTEGGPIPPTDDTVMTYALAEVLVEEKRPDPQRSLEKYLDLFERGILTKVGATTLRALERFKRTRNWFYAGVISERAAGNGVAMRISPLGLYAALKNLPLEDFYESVRHEGYATHRNELAILGAFAVAFGVHLNLREDLPKEEVLKEVVGILKNLGEVGPLVDRLEEALKLHLRKVSPADALRRLGTGGFVVETVASAYYLFLRSEEFTEGLFPLWEVGGDADTIGAVFGSLFGSFYGAATLPPALVERLEVLPWALRLTEGLLSLGKSPPSAGS